MVMKSARRAHLSALPSETEEPERWEVNEGGGDEGEQIGLLQDRRETRNRGEEIEKRGGGEEGGLKM